MNRYTPGPWRGYQNIIGADSTVVATINRPLGGCPSTETANAHLIAAAPDMLDTLGALGAWLIAPDLSVETLEGMRSLITATMNKALGKEKT